MDKETTLIDNLNGNTLAQALASTLGKCDPSQKVRISSHSELRIATAFFSPAGFKYIADYLVIVRKSVFPVLFG